MISPSRGDEVAGLDQNDVALAQGAADDGLDAGVVARAAASFLAWMSRRALRSVSACALPRPSAIASAKLANSTVNHSHTDTQKMKPAGASPLPASAWIQSTVVRMLPTYTTNMTGFRT